MILSSLFGFFILLLSTHAQAEELTNQVAVGVGCRELKLATHYCKNYDDVPTLKEYRPAQEAQAKCLAFYESIVRAAALFCRYDTDSARVESALNLVVAADNIGHSDVSQRTVLDMITDARGIISRYLDEARIISDGRGSEKRMLTRVDESKAELRKLLKIGNKFLREELHCQKSPTTMNAPPSFVLTGLVTRALEDQEKTANNFNIALNLFMQNLTRQLGALAHVQVQALTNTRNTGAMGQLKMQPLRDAARAPESNESGLPNPAPHESLAGGSAGAAAGGGLADQALKHAGRIGGTVARRGAARPFIQAVASRSAATAGRFSSELVQNVVKHGGKAAGVATVWAVTKLIFGGEVDGLAIGTLGIGITISAVGVSFWPATLLVVTIGYLESEIRRQWKAQEKAIVDPYMVWANNYFKSNPGVSHQQIAQAYSSIKRERAYCGKCGNMNTACEARNAFNDNWFDSQSPFGTFEGQERERRQQIMQQLQEHQRRQQEMFRRPR
jgi:hypothetical protein